MTKNDIKYYIEHVEEEEKASKLYAPVSYPGSHMHIISASYPGKYWVLPFPSEYTSVDALYAYDEHLEDCLNSSHYQCISTCFDTKVSINNMPDVSDYSFADGCFTTSAYLLDIHDVPEIYRNGKSEKDEDGWGIFDNIEWNCKVNKVKERDSSLARLAWMAIIDTIYDKSNSESGSLTETKETFSTFTGLSPDYSSKNCSFIFHRDLEVEMYTMPGIFHEVKRLKHFGYPTPAVPFTGLGCKFDSALYMCDNGVQVKSPYITEHYRMRTQQIKELLKLAGVNARIKHIRNPIKPAGEPWFLQKKEGDNGN